MYISPEEINLIRALLYGDRLDHMSEEMQNMASDLVDKFDTTDPRRVYRVSRTIRKTLPV